MTAFSDEKLQRLGLPRRFSRHKQGLPLIWLAWVMQVTLILVIAGIWLGTGRFP